MASYDPQWAQLEDDFEDEEEESGDDEYETWACGCGIVVDVELDGDHCPGCYACPPWGCDIEHDKELDGTDLFDDMSDEDWLEWDPDGDWTEEIP